MINNKEKDLNTYVNNICKDPFSIKYKECRIVTSNSARSELIKHKLSLEDCKNILENGYGAPRKRKESIIERWLDKGNKTYNVVIGKGFDNISNVEVWVLIHVGKFSRRKIK